MKDDLNVSHIFVVNSKGRFIRSTNEDPHLIPNAFSFCPKYKDLVIGTSNIAATPIIHPEPEPKPYKFLFVPTKDRKRLIEVGIRVDFIADTLAEALKSDKNVQTLSLYSPHGKAFGHFKSDNVAFSEEKISLPETFPSWSDKGDHYEFFTKVKSSHPSCCQCDISGTSKNGEYYYVLRSTVSKSEIKAILASTTNKFLLYGLLSILLAAGLGWFSSRRLVQNIELAVKKVKEIGEAEAFDKRINLTGDDEVAYLTKQFDKLLESLESSKSQLIDAEKAKAKLKMAREVSHNIRSPIIAIEMILPMLTSVPERLKNVLLGSANEIKELSDRLKNCKFGEDIDLTSNSKAPKISYIPALAEDIVNQKECETSNYKGLNIKLSIGEGTEKMFAMINPTELRAVLSNILNNAIEALPEHSGTIEVRCESEDNRCKIVIADNGVGIPSSCLKKLGKIPLSLKGGNTRGTGLIHAFKVVEDFGGKIEVSSAVGLGTSITIVLPAFQEPKTQTIQQIMQI